MSAKISLTLFHIRGSKGFVAHAIFVALYFLQLTANKLVLILTCVSLIGPSAGFAQEGIQFVPLMPLMKLSESRKLRFVLSSALVTAPLYKGRRLRHRLWLLHLLNIAEVVELNPHLGLFR